MKRVNSRRSVSRGRKTPPASNKGGINIDGYNVIYTKPVVKTVYVSDDYDNGKLQKIDQKHQKRELRKIDYFQEIPKN